MKNARTMLIALLAVAGTSVCIAGEAPASVGFELQRYPVGTIGSVVYRHPLGERSLFHAGLGYNDADREDEGEFDDEQASGLGISAGYRRFRDNDQRGWSYGGRVDLWSLDVDWIDQLGTPGENRGTSDSWVLQPTAVVARGWTPGERRSWLIELTLALGAEINVSTDGPDVGQGAIVLGGVSLHRRLRKP